MLFIFHAKLKRRVRTYFRICNQDGWKLLSDKCYCIYLGKFIWFVLSSFLETSVNVSLASNNTVCLKNHLLKNLNNNDCEFYFYFFSINLTFFFICFYYALNILTPLYRIGSWNANYTQVCNQNFHWARNPRSYFPFFKKELGRALPLPLLLPANCASDMSPDIHLNAS